MGNVHLFGHAVGVIGIFSIVDYPMMITNYQQNIPMKKPAYPSAASETTKIPHSTSYINNGRGRNGRALVVETRNFASLQCAGAVTVLPC